MTADNEPTVTEEAIVELARVAGLALDKERVAVLTPVVDDFLSEANRVNEFMSGRREVQLSVAFVHQELRNQEA
jgi:Asp-tRNA(Asn)/Glu-tRNA(Gln) amidotransferase C subunit